MEIKKAGPADLAVVGDITHKTISAVYPHYYPPGVVEFFLYWHRDECILPDLSAGEVYLLWEDGEAVGTVTLHGRELTRLYVLPEMQGRGYGRALLDFAEEAIGRACGRIVLEASLPAAVLYWKRGYRVVDCRAERQKNGDVLCWDIMEKIWTGPPEAPGAVQEGE